MRWFAAFFLMGTLILSACSLQREGAVPRPMDASDLAVSHHYKIPAKTNTPPPFFKSFDDAQLSRLVAIALTDSPGLRSAQARVVRAQQVAQGAAAALLPSVGSSGHAEKIYFPLHGDIPPPFNLMKLNQVGIGGIGLQFNSELDFFGKNRENLAGRISEAFAAGMDAQQARLMLAGNVADTWFAVQNAMAQQRFARENAELLKEQADIVVDRARQGIESNIPVKTALSNYQTALLSIKNYDDAEQQARHRLAVLMGKNPFTTAIDTPVFSPAKKPLTLPGIIPASVLGTRPDIASARALAEAAGHQVNVAKAAFYPNVNLRGLLGLQTFYFSRAFNLWLEDAGAGAAFDLPIFDAGARRANLGARYAEYDIAVNQYNATLLEALREVHDALTALRTLDAQIQTQKQVMTTTESNYHLFKGRYQNGIIDYMELIGIKQLLVEQKATLYQLQTRQKQAFAALLIALGGEFQV